MKNKKNTKNREKKAIGYFTKADDEWKLLKSE